MRCELSGDQVRIRINAVQAFEAWREIGQTFRHSYQGRMNWSPISGGLHLNRIIRSRHLSWRFQSDPR